MKQTTFAAVTEELIKAEKALANGEQPVTAKQLEDLYMSMCSNLDYMYRMISSMEGKMWESEARMHENLWKHLEGHLPPIKSSEQMERAIDALGLGEEFQVAKKTIYASNGKPSKLVYEIELK